jgi:signal transduction histidine kinase
MDELASVNAASLQAQIARQIDAHQAELLSRYQQALRETLFTSRSDLRPSALGRIASEEVAALKDFLLQHTPSGFEHGRHSCQVGLGEEAVLRTGQATRQFLIARVEDGFLAPALDFVDSYQNDVLKGFIQEREKTILSEQERIRGALERAISRYTVEIKEVQDMAQKATEANEFKSRFIARISHELRTPLGSLMGMAEMLQQNIFGQLSSEQQDITRRIIGNAKTLQQIFDELLDQEQLDSGELRLKDEIFSFRELVQTVHSNCLSLALQKGLAMQAKVDHRLPPKAIGDRRRIEQILSNLVVNAIKYTEAGQILVWVYKDGEDCWALQVKDTGIGISQEALTYIFEPFRQADETSGRKYGGVGLGLSIVQQLTLAMNGTVRVESELGRGSTFTVTLPLRKSVTGKLGDRP